MHPGDAAMTTSSLLILHEKCNKPAVEREWVEWHHEVHEPDIAATGAEHVTFWQLSAKPVPGMPGLGFSHVTIAEYATTDVPPFATALATMPGMTAAERATASSIDGKDTS